MAQKLYSAIKVQNKHMITSVNMNDYICYLQKTRPWHKIICQDQDHKYRGQDQGKTS